MSRPRSATPLAETSVRQRLPALGLARARCACGGSPLQIGKAGARLGAYPPCTAALASPWHHSVGAEFTATHPAIGLRLCGTRIHATSLASCHPFMGDDRPGMRELMHDPHSGTRNPANAGGCLRRLVASIRPAHNRPTSSRRADAPDKTKKPEGPKWVLRLRERVLTGEPREPGPPVSQGLWCGGSPQLLGVGSSVNSTASGTNQPGPAWAPRP